MFTKLVRIGRDAELKYLSTGTAVLEMSVVYDIGFGDNKKPQWVKLAMFGARAEKLAEHFKKGTQIVATMDDVKSEAWIKNGEAASTISAKLVEFEFAGGGAGAAQGNQNAPQQNRPQQVPAQQAPVHQQPAPQHAPQQQRQPAPQQQRQQAPVYYQQQQPQQSPVQCNDPSMDFDDDLPF